MTTKVIRTFVAVLIDEDLKQRISEVQKRVKQLAPHDVKWVSPDNFHITLKFLGNIEEDSIPDINAAVERAVMQITPFELSISGLGTFPSSSRARVVWVGSENGREQLCDLASAVDKALGELGYERDDKPFKAHITIGRVKEGKRLDKLATGIGEIDAKDLGTQRVLSVAVMQSELLREGPKYSPLSEVKLRIA